MAEPSGDPTTSGFESRWRSEDVDLNTSTPSVAWAYDYLLGGKDNFAVDRRASEALKAAAPEVNCLVWLGAVVRG